MSNNTTAVLINCGFVLEQLVPSVIYCERKQGKQFALFHLDSFPYALHGLLVRDYGNELQYAND